MALAAQEVKGTQCPSDKMQGINLMAERRERKQKSTHVNERTFNSIALKWWEQQRDSWA